MNQPATTILHFKDHTGEAAFYLDAKGIIIGAIPHSIFPFWAGATVTNHATVKRGFRAVINNQGNKCNFPKPVVKIETL